jgi:hypothetical protein
MLHGSSRLEEALFKRAPDGWTFNSPYPRLLWRPSTYLLTDAQKAILLERLRRALRVVRLLRFFVVPTCLLILVTTTFLVPHLLDSLNAGSLGAWLLFSLLVLFLASVLIPLIGIIHYSAVQPVLRTGS